MAGRFQKSFNKTQADVSRAIPRLRVKVNDVPRKLSQPQGAEGRLKLLRQTVTALFKYERIELNYNRAHESQGYAERLIQEAIRYGDCHTPTMELADFWILEKQLIHKLFKVLVPRYEASTRSYTRFFHAPRPYYGDGFYKLPKDNHIDQAHAHNLHFPKAVLELRGNPYPPILTTHVVNSKSLHNVLLRAANEERRQQIVEKSLSEQGALPESSARIQSILQRSAARLSEHDILGDNPQELSLHSPSESTGSMVCPKEAGESKENTEGIVEPSSDTPKEAVDNNQVSAEDGTLTNTSEKTLSNENSSGGGPNVETSKKSENLETAGEPAKTA